MALVVLERRADDVQQTGCAVTERATLVFLF